MPIKNWIFAKQNHSAAPEIAKKYNIPLFLANILINRGFCDSEESEMLLHPSQNVLHDPFLLDDMDKAVNRIRLAIHRNEIITIYGDYDVDGITSVSLLYLYLTSLGLKVNYYIPDRIKEGYGLNCSAIDSIRKSNTTLIITVDTGITACAEVEYARHIGIDCIITDHHECSNQLPSAVAVCNPKRTDCKYPFRSLAGVGVVFKLICALHGNGDLQSLFQKYGDLVALGTISDVMPILDENRYIVSKGLEALSHNRRGLYHLMLSAGVQNLQKISVFDVSFLLAPRINAAGRIGDSLRAVELLISNDVNVCRMNADYLCGLNNQRQMIEAKIFEQADAIIQQKKLFKNSNALILWKEGWHHGVIGIVASRIKDKYGLPTILFSVAGDKAKGSGRSIAPLNLYDTLSSFDHDWLQFGGHAMAAGVTLPTKLLPQFSQEFCAAAAKATQDEPYYNSILIDAVLNENDFTMESFRAISMLEPFGMSNEVPLFCVKNAIIKEVKPIGNQKHLRLVFQIGSQKVSAVYFGMRMDMFAVETQNCVDVLFQASINEFRGNTEIQMIVKEIRPYQKKFDLMIKDAEKALIGEFDRENYPDRAIISNIYRFCKKMIESNLMLLDILSLPVLIKKSGMRLYNIQTILSSMQILRQIGVLHYDVLDTQLMLISVDESQKVSLESSSLYRKFYS